MSYCKYLTTLLFLFPHYLFAQDITGLWKGTLYNDTTQQYYKYEIGISKEKGKYTGFSHTWFILEDKQYFGVKKVKVNVAPDGKIIIEDDGLISNNYPVPPSRNIRQLNILTLDGSDALMTLSGPFSTNRTKEYRSLTGSVSLQRKNDFWQSALIPHLKELGKQNELSFVKEESESLARTAGASLQLQQAQRLAEKENAKNEMVELQILKQEEKAKKTTAALLAKKSADAIAEEERVKAVLQKQLAQKEKEMKRIAELEATAKASAAKDSIQTAIALQQTIQKEAAEKDKAIKALAKKEADAKTLAEKQQAREEYARQQKAIALENEKLTAARLKAKQELAAKAAADTKQVAQAKQVQAYKEKADKIIARQQAEAFAKKEKEQIALAIQKEQQLLAEKEKANTAIAKQQADIQLLAGKQSKSGMGLATNAAAANVSQRTTIVQQTVSFSSDSLQLSLYDNGEIDGDTVSVIMNGQLILAKQGLSTTAVKKTIYIPSTLDNVELIMYAESLGSIPPNTGLLVVKDGKNLYEVRFSGDLQKNASIVFKRRKE
jgi:hypothetical protein